MKLPDNATVFDVDDEVTKPRRVRPLVAPAGQQ
jgi:hypothetical protein